MSHPDLDPNTAPPLPVFYDPRKRRWTWVLRVGGALGLLLTIGAVIVVISLIALPLMPYNQLPHMAVVADVGNLDPIATQHEDRMRRQIVLKLAKEKRKLARFTRTAKRRARLRDQRAAAFLRDVAARHAARVAALKAPAVPSAPPPGRRLKPVIAGFYVDWEQASAVSAKEHINQLTHFIPEWLHLKAAGANFTNSSPSARPFVDARSQQDISVITPMVRAHRVPILPLLNNFTTPMGQEAGTGNWDTNAAHQVLSNPVARRNMVQQLKTWLVQNQMQGVNIDFESLDVDDRANLVSFMKELYAALNPLGLLVTQDVQLEDNAYDLKSLARWCNWVVPMFYDEHAGGTAPGPIADVHWTEHYLKVLLQSVPASKLVMGVSNEAYNWVARPGQTSADSLTFQNAVETAKESQPDAVIHLDRASLNPTFSYSEDAVDPAGHTFPEPHVVWMQDATTAYNQLHEARQFRVRGGAIWALGEEDPTLWTFFGKGTWNQRWGPVVENGGLDRLSYRGTGLVQFDGEGGLLQPKAEPADGARDVTLDTQSGLITAEAYRRDAQGNPLIPTSYIIRRYGGTNTNVKKQIVLTFDDGPDPTWTPQILSILSHYHVPAVFFVVGQQAEDYPGLVAQEYKHGCLIGNHSWDHPQLDDLTPAYQRTELTSTQRVIQAITGHSTTLFRPPYGGDVEPTTGAEVRPIDLAAHMNYITVGEMNDPQDWRLHEFKPGTEVEDPNRPRTVKSIVDSVVVERNVGSIVLLHDAGGDRSLTVAALPQIITRLRGLGYTFVGLDAICGIPASRLMPVITGRDAVLGGNDRIMFEVSYLFQRTLTTLFLLSIWLGVSRIMLFLGLALVQRHREKARAFPAGYTPFVSVVIAAFNEEPVIVRTVRALLDGQYQNLEVIVVDDGSSDGTLEAAKSAFQGDPRVRLLHKPNGGKASALNVGMSEAKGEILVALDADTLFAPDTVARLARHFADPEVGAVSGNVRVGNAHNLFTRWQALEYITSQNFDRRGYDLLNCITVVPGAVGAMRKSAVIAAGGYSGDTLAEDMDLTWRMRREGWRIVNDNTAMAYTEAPETLRNLARQRFRWAFGTLQCLYKHRSALFTCGAFGWLALPSLWVYQILFPAVSPFMDIGMVYSLFERNFLMFANLFALMAGIELVAAFIAIRMDRGPMRLLPLVLLQRLVYRQLMYYVVVKSIFAAVRGHAVGWNKLERTGTAAIDGDPVDRPRRRPGPARVLASAEAPVRMRGQPRRPAPHGD